MIDVRTMAHAIGGDVVGRDMVVAPGPGHSRKDRSLSVRLTNDDDFVVFSHAGDDWQACKDHVRRRLGWPVWRLGDEQDRYVAPSRVKDFDRAVVDAENEQHITEEDRPRIERAVAIWNQAINPHGTEAELYLASRKLVLTDDVANNVLRFHPACAWRDENTGQTIYIHALIAAFRSVDDDVITGIHRVRLDRPELWPKAERRMSGIVRRAAVKLDPLDSTLHIGEGIETCMAARQLGYSPTWALGSVGAISRFPLIAGVTRLRILGETGEASARAIELCGRRWHAAGRKVQRVMPSVGSDLNDEVMAAQHG